MSGRTLSPEDINAIIMAQEVARKQVDSVMIDMGSTRLSDADVKAIAKAVNGEMSDEEKRVLKALASHSTVEAVEELAKFAGWLVTGQQAIGKLMIRLTIAGLILLIVVLFGGRIDLSHLNIGK